MNSAEPNNGYGRARRDRSWQIKWRGGHPRASGSRRWKLCVCKKLGLKADPLSTQVVQRDRHAQFSANLAVIASSIDRWATEFRHLQRTEVLELEEYFSPGQKGSSAMPHKRNPITGERLSGLARVIRGNAVAALENVALWHERDISHSSVERIIFPDSCILMDYMLATLTDLVAGLQVYPAQHAGKSGNHERALFQPIYSIGTDAKGTRTQDRLRSRSASRHGNAGKARMIF